MNEPHEAVIRAAKHMDRNARRAYNTYRKAVRKPHGSNGRRKLVAKAQEQFDEVEADAKSLKWGAEFFSRPDLMELRSALRSGKL